jgi:peroxiredoxin
MLTSNDFTGLINQRFAKNFFPIPATNEFRIGTLAPPFELFNVSTGTRVRLSDYAGNKHPDKAIWNRPTLLAFTRIFTEKQYCPLCYPHIIELNQAYEQFLGQGAHVVMITSTDIQQSQIVLQDLGLKMPLLCDPSCTVFRRYQVGQALGAPLPAQFLLDPDGRIRFRHLFSFLEPNASIDRLLNTLKTIKDNG